MHRPTRLERLRRPIRPLLALTAVAAIGTHFPSAGAGSAACLAADAQADSAAIDLTSMRRIEGRANTFTRNTQGRAALAVDPQGRFLAVWDSRRQEQGTYGVFAQRFDQLGRRLGTEIHINEFTKSIQHAPAAAFDAQGRAWVVWESFGQDGDGFGIVLRRFGEEGDRLVPLAGDSLVNLTTTGDQFAPAISLGPDGTALVTWSSAAEGDRIAARGRLFSAAGEPLGDEIAILDASGLGARNITHAALPDGRFLITCTRLDLATRASRVEARLLDPSDGSLGEAVAISASAGRDGIEPAFAVDAAGRGTLAWMQAREDDGYDVLAVRLDPHGALLGEPFVVARRQGSDWLSGAAVAAHPDGRFAVAWNVYGEKTAEIVDDRLEIINSASILAQVYDDQARPVGSPVRINAFDEGEQALAAASGATRLVWTGDGQFAAAWNGQIEGDRIAAGLTVYSPPDLNPPAPAVVEPLAAGADIDDANAAPIRDPDWKPLARDAFVQAEGPDYGFLGYMQTEWQPPDPDIAAGPSHVVIVVNMRVAVFTHDGQEVFHEYLEDFFRGQGSNNFVFDPVAAWDPLARRFVIASAERNGSISRLVIAVSRTENPLDGWHKYGFNTNHIGSDIDFENLGIGTDAYHITADYFGGQGNVIHIFEKAPMLVGSPVTLKHINTSGSLLSLGSVQTFDAGAPAQYFATSWISRTTIRLYAVRNSTGTPTIVSRDITVPYMEDPPDAAQRGSSNRLSTIDRRIKNGVYRNGTLWLSHSIGENSTARVRWYEIAMNGWPQSGQNPSLTQMGTINNGAGEHNWFPDIGVSDEGDVVITASRSSSNDYPYIARHIRKIGDPTGTVRAPVRLKESNGPHTGSRWGDYSGIDEDPDRPGVFWSHNEYNTTGQSWRTWVGEINAKRGLVLSVNQIIRGQPSTLTVSNATANGTVYFAYSVQGLSDLFVPFLDVTVGLRSPTLIGSRTADATGTAVLTMNVPPNAPPIPVWIQAAENRNASNIIAGQIN